VIVGSALGGRNARSGNALSQQLAANHERRILTLAEWHGFDVLVSSDQNIVAQQNGIHPVKTLGTASFLQSVRAPNFSNRDLESCK